MSHELLSASARPLTAADAGAVHDVAVACDLEEYGEAITDLSDVRRDLALAASRWYGVDTGDGSLAGYAWAAKLPADSAVEVDVRIPPGGDMALGPPLLEVVRRAASEIDADRVVHAFVGSRDLARRRWFEAVGGAVVRHFWRMTIDLGDEPPAAPVPPGGVVIRPVTDELADKRAFFDVIDVSFRDHFGHDDAEGSFELFLERSCAASGFDLALWWLATVGGVPAAALQARTLPAALHVNALGTLREFRGRGLGRQLLQTAFAEAHRRGFRRVELGVDAANPTGAVQLYTGVGMTPAHAWVVYELPPLP